MFLPSVSVILVCRNEEKTIEHALNSLINQTRKPDEIIVVDGQSTDRTVSIIEKFAEKINNIKIITNVKKYTPYGLNLGIKNSKGNFVFIAGSHTEFDKKYVEYSVEFLMKHPEASAVGGVSLATPVNAKSCLQKSMAFSYSSPFGTAARHRYQVKEPLEVDTVAYACYRRKVFDTVGYFNERLLRNQDIEFNYRMRKKGLKIFLLPITNNYYVPHGLGDFIKKNFSNGFWNYITLKISPHGISFRHFIPLIFVVYLICLFLVLVLSKNTVFNIILAIPFFIYLLLDTLFSLKYAIKEKNVLLLFCSLFMFLLLHISYGLGTFWSIIKSILFTKGEKV
ncbi:glycosyltransferase family 2 protein [Petrotoga miotherma]|uniref:glycosyltransferase family 2 protein n=1 Tax=Petrotoga miotherma TaxID=28237 RepID=UPI000CA03F0C|nr:glycosyltransferase family 2 protein [Petrotoga miotherma]